MSDSLLYVLSSKGQVSLGQFKSIFEFIFPKSEYSISSFLRIFDSLGYCEFDYSNRKIAVTPPTLVRLPICGLPQAVLTGARSPSLIAKLRAIVKNKKDQMSLMQKTQNIDGISLPTTYILSAASVDALKILADETGIMANVITPFAWTLSSVSVDLGAIKDSLTFTDVANLNWPKTYFDTKSLTFIKNPIETPLISYRNPRNQQFLHKFKNAEKEAVIDRDWGRYLILSIAKKNVLLYDQKRFTLCAPVSTPLPCLLARAAVFCSGIQPKIVIIKHSLYGQMGEGRYYLYRNVTPDIAKMIAMKVHQTLIINDLEHNEEGSISLC